MVRALANATRKSQVTFPSSPGPEGSYDLFCLGSMGWVFLLTVSLLLGCLAEMQHGLSEAEANEILVLLEANGISGNKSPEGRTGDWLISVPRPALRRSWQIMQTHGLPRRQIRGFETTFGQSSLIPTTTEDRVRIQQATAGELERSLMSMASVLDARVHLVIPEENLIRSRLEEAALPRASVLLVRQVNDQNPAPLNTDSVQRLVSGAVNRLEPENVVVVTTERGVRTYHPSQGLVHFGPLTISETSRTPLKIILGLLILLNILLGCALVYTILRGKRRRSANS